MAFTKEQEYKVEHFSPTAQSFKCVEPQTSSKKTVYVVGTKFHRHVVVPGDDVTNEPTVVQLIANAIHDSATVSAYQSS